MARCSNCRIIVSEYCICSMPSCKITLCDRCAGTNYSLRNEWFCPIHGGHSDANLSREMAVIQVRNSNKRKMLTIRPDTIHTSSLRMMARLGKDRIVSDALFKERFADMKTIYFGDHAVFDTIGICLPSVAHVPITNDDAFTYVIPSNEYSKSLPIAITLISPSEKP